MERPAGNARPLERLRCLECGAHSRPRPGVTLCSVCGCERMEPIDAPPIRANVLAFD